MPQYLKTQRAAPAQNGSAPDVSTIVRDVIQEIRQNGDTAVRKYSEKFDSWSPPAFKLSQEQIEAFMAEVPQQLIDDIKEVQRNVRTFAEAQRATVEDFELEIQPGVFLGQKNLPINRVGA